MMDFDRWFANQKPHPSNQSKPASTGRWIWRLTQDARYDREDFERGDHNGEGISLADRGCVCFTGCAPCTFCTHPGNPLNQEDESCLEKVQVPEDYEDDYEISEVC